MSDLILSKLRVGYLVDFGMKTYHVTAYNHYDYGEGYTADEVNQNDTAAYALTPVKTFKLLLYVLVNKG